MNTEKYKNSSKKDLIWMIRLAKFFRFFTTKTGDFLTSFLFIVGIPVLFCGLFSIVVLIAMVAHLLYMAFLNDMYRRAFGTNESYDEYTHEITMFKKYLAEKQEENK